MTSWIARLKKVSGFISMFAVSSAMLLVAVYGSPPHPFFMALKGVVSGTLAYGAWLSFDRNKTLMPLSILLIALAAIHLFAKMRRAEWVTFNWAAIAALGLVAISILFRREVQAA